MCTKFSRAFIIFIAAAVLSISSFALSITHENDPYPEIIYQVDESHPPFEFSSDNELYGFGMDLGRMIFSSGIYNVRYSSDAWNIVYDRILKGEIDICGLVAITESRKKDILFSKPIVRTYRAVYGRRDLKIEKIEDIEEYRIGVQKSDYSETILKDELGIENYQAFKDLEECILALREGRIDVLFGNQEVTNYLLVKNQMSSSIIPHILNLYPVDLAYGVSKARPELVTYINEQIEKLQESGIYEQVFQKHFYRNSEHYYSSQQRMYVSIGLFLLLVVIAVMTLSSASIKHLNKMVHKATSKLTEEQELLRTTLLSISDGVAAVDRQCKVTFMNHAAEQLTGLTEKEYIGRPLDKVLNIINPDSGSKYEVPLSEVIEKGSPVNFNSLNLLVSDDGSRHLILGSASPIRNNANEVTGVLVTFQEISEKKHSQETMRYHEYYDNLTDLPNRKLFNQYLNSAVDSARLNSGKLAVLIIDLDYFKSINNSLGHHIGDKLLMQVSESLIRILAQNDVLARMGGDSFAILMPQIKEMEQAQQLAGRIIEELGREFHVDGHELYISASIGIAAYPDDGSTPDEVLRYADTALYSAKASGRGTYKSYMLLDDEKVKQRYSLAKDLHMALERNEMSLHYQPKVSSGTGKIIGMEALIRWNHPDRGLISPGVFIPLAEETGLIKQLDNWVLKTACSQFLSLKNDLSGPFRLSVNLSAYQLRSHSFVDMIEKIFEDNVLTPSELELEITETTAMENIDFTIKILARLKDMGVNISIDDFGTGYSSLNYLRFLPIHIIKIDRSFIQDMGKDANTMVIIKSIIDVAHSLGLKVTAEGVEMAEQMSLLKQMGCDELQGFLIGKPLPLFELQNMLFQ